MQVLKDPKAFQLLADETRRKIIYLLRVKEMTVSQLATELNLTPQALYHHIKKLLEGDMVTVVREERVGHIIESYYRATAETFSLHSGKASTLTFRDKKQAKELMTIILNALKKLGFNLEHDENKLSQVIDIQADLEECCEDIGKLEDEVLGMEDLDFLTQEVVLNFVKTLSMSDKEFARQLEKQKKFRELLLSLVKSKKP